MSQYCEDPDTHKNRNINKCQLFSSSISSDSLATPKKRCSESHTEVGKVTFSGHIRGSYSDESFLKSGVSFVAFEGVSDQFIFSTISGKYSTSTFSVEMTERCSFCFNHWDGYFYHTGMNKGSQVVPRPPLANLYMALTIGQLCSLVCTSFVLFSPHNNPMGYMPWINPFCRYENWGIERWRNLPKATVLKYIVCEGPRPLGWVHNTKNILT